MEYYSALRRKDTLTYVVAYEDIMLCEISQSQKYKRCVVKLIRIVKVAETEDRPVDVRIWERERRNFILLGYKVSVLQGHKEM